MQLIKNINQKEVVKVMVSVTLKPTNVLFAMIRKFMTGEQIHE